MGMREEFEAANSHRAWFVHGGRVDDGPEGYVYDDFTTDMCWTCWVDSRAKLVIELPFAFKDCDSRDATDVREAIHAVGVSYK